MKFTNTNGTGKNITSEVTIDTFVAAANIWLAPQLRLSNLNAAAATLTYILRHTTSDDVTIKEHYFSKAKRTTTNTVDGEAFAPFLVKSGEKVVWRQVSSNSNDTNVSWSVDWVDAEPVQAETSGNTLSVDGDGEVVASNAGAVDEEAIAAAVWDYLAVLAAGGAGSMGQLVVTTLDAAISVAIDQITTLQTDMDYALSTLAGIETTTDKLGMMIVASDGDWQFDALALALGPTSSITVGPIVGSRNPTNAVGTKVSLEQFRAESKEFQLTVVDSAGSAVSLAGKTLRFIAETTADPAVKLFDVEHAGFAISGGSNNIATFTVTASMATLDADTYQWRLWDVTDGTNPKVLLHGPWILLSTSTSSGT